MKKLRHIFCFSLILLFLSAFAALAEPENALLIAGDEDVETLRRFESETGIPALLCEPIHASGEKLTQAMTSRTDACDLYVLSVGEGFLPLLKEKGYGTPFDRETAEALFPQMDDELLSLLLCEEGYIAFPKSAAMRTLCVRREAADAMGISPEELPAAFEELLSWLTEQEEKAWAEGIPLLDGFSTRRFCFGLLMDLYMAQCEAEGVEPDFQGDDFPRLVKLLDESFPAGEETDAAPAFGGEPTPPLLGYADIADPQTFAAGWEPLELSLNEGGPAFFPLQMEVYLINPFSKQKDAALAYVAAASALRDAETVALLSQTAPPPTADTETEKELAACREEIVRLEERLMAATEEMRPELQAELDGLRERQSWLEQRVWSFSPEDVARVRGYRERCVLRGSSSFTARVAEALSPYTRRFGEGGASAEEFLRDVQNLAKLAQGER